MKLSEVLTFIAGELDDPAIANLRTEVFEGRAQLEDLRARSWTKGAGCLVAWTGARQTKGLSDGVDITFQFAASLSVPSRVAPAAGRKAVIADLTQAVIVRLQAIEWPEDCGRPELVRAQNLYTLEDSRQDLSRAVVLWEQTIRSKYDEDAPELPPLELVHHEQHPEGTDPAPIVTTIEVEQ